MAKTELHVNRLTATLSSNFGARLQQATVGYNCNQGHEWIEQDMYYKTSLVNISRIMHEMTCSSRFTQQQNITESVRKTATASTLLNKLDALSTRLTKNTWMAPM